MSYDQVSLSRTRESLLSTHTVLRNTYLLLGLTLLFSGFTAYIAMATQARMPNILVFLLGTYGLMFATTRFRNSGWGLVLCFAFTGFMGYTLGPILNMVLKTAYGAHVVMSALGTTGLVFFGLSAVSLITRKDFSFLGKFLMVGMFVLLAMMLVGIFTHMPLLQLAISAAFAIFSAVAILFETSQIINGGQTNYIMATISLYVSIYNIFLSLLNLFGAMGDRR
jgi:modulator of FtsH protease